ncbi:MAG: glutamate 5-kinase, partial [Sedimentisphaerales bacterium]|nr:glutamate 5-kinase [Sedimentisphaerales bacterium]
MRDLSDVKRIVIKVGTSTLTCGRGIDSDYIHDLASQVAALHKASRQVVLVTSGAIGMGVAQLDLEGRPSEIPMRQACAAIGQPILMAEYRRHFEQFGIKTAQVLLTAEVFNNRKTYLNLRNAIETLLKMQVIPIVNENDSISTDEIGTTFGDNDRLSALVASKIDAELLIILTDIDALYDKDPRRCPDARPIETVCEITDQLLAAARGSGTKLGTGGMRT